MAELFSRVISLLLTPECMDQYFVNFNFFHGECMKATISKALGLVIIAGSLTVKVPQILKIVKNKSGEGISLLGALLELSAITSIVSYSYLKQFPFSAWGDGLFVGIQTVAVIALIFFYKNQTSQMFLFLGVFTAFVFLFSTGAVPITVLWLMQIMNLFGKSAQAWTNYKNQGTGQLSAITCWMQFGGCVARVFTSVQETGDATMILSYVAASILNGIIVFQFFYYGKPSKKKAKAKKKGKKSD